MPVPFIMPKFDMDQEKATIISWNKREGDQVKRDDIVLVVETEKIAIEVPAPADGTLAGIRFGEGATVPVTTTIAYILKEGERFADISNDIVGQKPAEAQPSTARLEGEADQRAPLRPAGVISATPVAARIAEIEGVDLDQVKAPGGRIRREDVVRHLREQEISRSPTGELTGKVAATPAARRLARELEVPLQAVTGSGPHGRIQSADVVATAAAAQPSALAQELNPAEIIPLAGKRLRIAERMQASFHELPHIALSVEVDMSAFEAFRGSMNEVASRQSQEKVSMTALLVRITAWALARHPYLNASLRAGQIFLWNEINIGIATAVSDGLIVPVIRSANTKPVQAIVEELTSLTKKAREGTLSLGEVQHGTFTISNLGMFGIHQFRAIINPPESAILAVGSIVRKPIVINDRDEIEVRPMVTLTLSADHRIIDGIVAARFLNDLVTGLQSPQILLY